MNEQKDLTDVKRYNDINSEQMTPQIKIHIFHTAVQKDMLLTSLEDLLQEIHIVAGVQVTIDFDVFMVYILDISIVHDEKNPLLIHQVQIARGHKK